MHLTTFALSLLAFALLALAMHRHQRDLFGDAWSPSRTRAVRLAGFTVLIAAMAFAVHRQGWSLGLVAWCGHIGAAAGLVTLVMIATERRKAAQPGSRRDRTQHRT